MSYLFQPGESPAPGQRFEFHQFLQGQRGGLMLYPTSGVITGMGISAVSILTPGPTTSVLQLTIAPGQIRLDGVLVTITSEIAGLQLPCPDKDLSLPIDQVVYAYVNPTRLVPALTEAPETPVLNDKYIAVAEAGPDDYLVEEFLQWNGTKWVPFPAIKERIGYGHNNLPMNQIIPMVDTATSDNKNFSSKPERVVYHKTGFPLWLTAPGRAYLRQSASIQLAAVKVNAGAVVSATGYSAESALVV